MAASFTPADVHEPERVFSRSLVISAVAGDETTWDMLDDLP